MDRKPRGKPALASSGTCSPPTSAAQAQLVGLFPHLPAAGAPAPGREPVLYANQHAPFARGLLLVREWQVTWVCPIGMKEAGDGLCVGEGFPIRRRGQRGASSAVPGPRAARCLGPQQRQERSPQGNKPRGAPGRRGRQAGRPGFLLGSGAAAGAAPGPGPLESACVNGRKRSLFGDASCCQTKLVRSQQRDSHPVLWHLAAAAAPMVGVPAPAPASCLRG